MLRVCLDSLCALSVCSILSGQYFQNRSPFLTILVIVVYYHETEFTAEKLVRYLQGQGHSEGLYSQNGTVSAISSKLLVRLQTNLV